MQRCSMLLLTAVVAGGCSRDAPLVAPPEKAFDAMVTPSTILASPPVDPNAAAIDDALTRLVPALGEFGTALRATLSKMSANRGDEATRRELSGLLDALASTMPASHRADFDALRLELVVATK